MEIVRRLPEFELNGPASTSQILEAEWGIATQLPDEYRRFLEHSNGGKGFIGGWFIDLWKAEELGERNRAYHPDDLRELVLIGSDGAGEAFGFDARTAAKPFVMIPFDSLEWEFAFPVAPTFEGFLERLLATEAGDFVMKGG